MEKFGAIICLIFLIANKPAYAVKVRNLYQAEIPVMTQSDPDRTAAIKEGFRQVLIKLSGDPQITERPEIKEDLKKAEYYVQEFGYASGDANLISQSIYHLQINFSRDDINRLMRKADIHLWGENRPLILIWLGKIKDNQSEIISSESENPLVTTLQQHGKKIGLPLIFPMMDVTEMSTISIDNLTEESLPLLQRASKRYSPDAYLIGTMKETNGSVEMRLILVLGDLKWGWKITAADPEIAATEALNQVTEALSKHFMANENSATLSWLKLEISNMTERGDLSQLVQKLKQSTAVRKVQLAEISGDSVEIAVLTNNTIEDFQHAMLDQHLVLKSEDDANKKIFYEWTH